MRKETIKYTDYDGEERTEDFYFNLNKAEVMELEMSWDGGLGNFLKKIVAEKDPKRLIEMFKMILVKSYGEKSIDGKRFLKYDEDGHSLAQKNFVPTEAYSELFMKLSTDDKAASDFIREVLPQNINDQVEDKGGDKPNALPGPGAEDKK